MDNPEHEIESIEFEADDAWVLTADLCAFSAAAKSALVLPKPARYGRITRIHKRRCFAAIGVIGVARPRCVITRHRESSVLLMRSATWWALSAIRLDGGHSYLIAFR